MTSPGSINVDRLVSRIQALAEISAPGAGVTRLALTPEWEQANQQTADWMREAGMIVRRDAAGNLIGRYEGTSPESPVVMIGSHLDSVINGGMYDGVLGVLAGIEVVQSLAEEGVQPVHPIEVVSFTDEEGVRFRTAFIGSRAMAGDLTMHDLDALDEEGISVAQALRALGFQPDEFPSAVRDEGSILAYFELHIEQGPVLEQQEQPAGVVTGIAGITRYTFRVEGTPGHAGTVPMVHRHDAMTGAAQMVLAVEQVARREQTTLATVGTLSVEPGAANVIPGAVEGIVDIRHIDEESRREAFTRIYEEWQRICEVRGLTLTVEQVAEASSAPCSSRLVSNLSDALRAQGLEPLELQSGAGHDAMEIARIADIGMLFVRCKHGISHNPVEEASPEDIAIGTAALKGAVLNAAGRGTG